MFGVKMLRTRLLIAVLVLLTAHSVLAQDKPSMAEVDRIRLAEAFRIGGSLGDRVWKVWGKAPFAVLLVTPEDEFLVRHPRPSKDFILIGYDAMLKSDVYFRKRIFSPGLMATFPVGGVSTIVIGRAENTDKKTSTPWVITMLHEHFHQLQDSQPNSYAETQALNLSRGDQTGMWMLNYAFPYDSPEVKDHFSVLSRLLLEALQAKNGSLFSTRLAAYLEARRQLQKMLSSDDYKYFSFQLWKEGLARYTEYRVAKLAAHEYKPTKQFRALKDFTSFGTVADQILDGTMKELSQLRLEDSKRVAFYPLGAGEGLLLDRAHPKWQGRYFIDKFYVEKYFGAAK
jgi:hypothetical protein